MEWYLSISYVKTVDTKLKTTVEWLIHTKTNHLNNMKRRYCVGIARLVTILTLDALEEAGVYDEFIEESNFDERNSQQRMRRIGSDVAMNHSSASTFIGSFFSWDESKKGNDYWFKLYTKTQDLIDERKYTQ